MKVNKEVMRKIVATIKNNKKEKGVNKMTRKESTLRKILLRGGEVGRSLIGTEAYYDLIEEFKEDVFYIFLIIVSVDCIDISCETEELDSMIVDLHEYEDFYNDVLDWEDKMAIEKDLMEALESFLIGTKGYVIGYLDEEPVMIMSENYYEDYVLKYLSDLYNQYFECVDLEIYMSNHEEDYTEEDFEYEFCDECDCCEVNNEDIYKEFTFKRTGSNSI